MVSFSSIPEAIEDIKRGKLVIVVSNKEKGHGGYLMMPASLATPETLAIFANHGNGMVVMPKKGDKNVVVEAYGISVDKEDGTSGGLSFHDKLEVFNGYDNIIRAGRAQACMDLAVRAGFDRILVLCEIVDAAGNMAGLTQIFELAQKENLKVVVISDLIHYGNKKDSPLERAASTVRMPTKWGAFTAYCYKSVKDGIEYVAMVKGDIGDGENVLVRVHSECLTGDIFGSKRCDCGPKLALAMEKIEKAGRGVLVYLRGHKGRGIGLGHKLMANNLQDDGDDTIEENEEMGLPINSSEYWVAVQILHDLGVRSLKLLTNTPYKSVGLFMTSMVAQLNIFSKLEFGDIII